MSTETTGGTTGETTGADTMVEPEFKQLRVASKREIAKDIYLFELRSTDGQTLPEFSAGSHLTVELPGGARRNYSLCSDPAEIDYYQIAVKRDANGRGGSMSMTDDVKEGDLIAVSEPRNNFELTPRSTNFIFVAGGIGITPVLSMMRYLKNSGKGKFKLYYCTRDADSTAFVQELKDEFPGVVKIHHDNGNPDDAFDFWPVFEKPTNAHVYCCGPRGLMDAVKDMSGHWAFGSVHFESFGVDASIAATNTPFDVKLAKSGKTVHIPAGKTILEVLRADGIRVMSSCESGTCGSCKTRLLEGEADHRDMVMSDDDREHNIMVCVSRAKSPELVLDL